MNLLRIARIPPVTVGKNASVRDALETMRRENAGALVIVEDGLAVGIFTESDLLRRVVARGLSLPDTELQSVMTSPLTVATPETSSEDALRLMVSNHVRHLPILDDEGRPRAMLSTRHLLRSMVENLSDELHSLNAYICADGIGG
jgi:CBS domain-containing protein